MLIGCPPPDRVVISFFPFILSASKGKRQPKKPVMQLPRDTRKSKEEAASANVVDWTFAKKAQAELKIK